MDIMSWWRPGLNPQGLSQGDVVQPLPIAVSVFPPKRLQQGTGKRGVEIWTPTSNPAKSHFLFEGREDLVIVVSHDCDLDKEHRNAKVLVAPVRRLDALPPEVQASILGQEHISMMPLPDVPGLGNHYANLRLISPTPREFLSEERRVASMSVEGVERTQVQLAKFFTRLAPPAGP
jgi:hypothetical protein